MARVIIKTAQGPYKLMTSEGEKKICMCGLSKNQPFCDGSHHKTKDEDTDALYQYDEAGERSTLEEEDGEDCCCGEGCCGDDKECGDKECGDKECKDGCKCCCDEKECKDKCGEDCCDEKEGESCCCGEGCCSDDKCGCDEESEVTHSK